VAKPQGGAVTPRKVIFWGGGD